MLFQAVQDADLAIVDVDESYNVVQKVWTNGELVSEQSDSTYLRVPNLLTAF